MILDEQIQILMENIENQKNQNCSGTFFSYFLSFPGPKTNPNTKNTSKCDFSIKNEKLKNGKKTKYFVNS